MGRDALVTAFRLQAGGCKLFGSPLYQGLCEAAERDVAAGGPVWQLAEDFSGDPLRGFLPLRILGAVHERVLAGAAPELARHYPSAGGSPEWPGVWHAFREVVASQTDALRPRLARFPQTNEVRRCTSLLPAFLCVARRTGLPLHVRELGASAGLNLLWDRYHYELGPHRWGDPRSPVRVAADWTGPAAPFSTSMRVASRAGCDIAPRRIADDAEARRLEAYVWADQTDRLAPLRAAVRLAREDPPRLDEARAEDWLPRELADAAPDAARVVHHSAFWIYLAPESQAGLREVLAAEGAHADARRPLAWLRHESPPERPAAVEIRLTLWPPGQEWHVADGHPHGRRVEWFGDAD